MNNRGYTLIELSVVVLIVGLTMLLASPRVHDAVLNDELKAAAGRLIAAVDLLRDEAVRERTEYHLHLDLARQTFWSSPADATAEKRAELEKKAAPLPAEVRLQEVRRAYEGRTVEGEVVLRFSPKGYADPAVIHLAKGERAVTLVVNPFLPGITVYDKYVDFYFTQEERAAGL